MWQLYLGRVIVLMIVVMVGGTIWGVVYGDFLIGGALHVIITVPLGLKLARDCIRSGREAQAKRLAAKILGVPEEEIKVFGEEK